MNIVVMGVAGSGKSTIGQRLARALGLAFVEGDDLHPQANVDKMSMGLPLNDDDRWPWLNLIADRLGEAAGAVVSCSALKRSYRDVLRSAGPVRFVYIDMDPSLALVRVAERSEHFMKADMVDSQFAALEAPAVDELDVLWVPAEWSIERQVAAAKAKVGVATEIGGSSSALSADDLRLHLDNAVLPQIEALAPGRVLLVPPDHTRLYSGAGDLTSYLRRRLIDRGIEVGVLPALGTHAAMTDDDAALLFGPELSSDDLLVHDWRNGVVELGTIGAAEVAAWSEGAIQDEIPVQVDRQLFDGWDLVVSLGQVVPHEVIGMANFTKNLVIGLGGAPTINRSHFLGAVCDMETIMGRTTSPVRQAVDAAFDRFIAPAVPVLWLLTVMEDTAEGVQARGMFSGWGGTCDSGGDAYRAAAALASTVNIDDVERPLERVVCWLDPAEFRSTWLGNKAIYRTRMAMADEGELIVLAPGVHRFGEDDQVDTLIRRHGYRGRDATLTAMDADPELAENLSAAAHLIHGSSEGRFSVTYCTDPSLLSQAEVESVGFAWANVAEMLETLGLAAGDPASGDRIDQASQPFHYISNPALGLWAYRGDS